MTYTKKEKLDAAFAQWIITKRCGDDVSNARVLGRVRT
jgi:hypothetical protein